VETTDRRTFLRTAAMGVVGAVTLAALDGYKNVASAASTSLDKLTILHFLPFTGQSFNVSQGSGAPYSFKLRKVEDAGYGFVRLRRARRPFSLLFDAPANAPLSDSIYHVEHPILGRLDLFMARVGRQTGATTFEAIFG
jgi:hypothetical protein